MTESKPQVFFDLDDFEDIESACIQVKHPLTGAPVEGMYVMLAGPEHPKRRELVLDRQRQARAKMMKAQRMQLSDPAEDEASELTMLVACTLGLPRKNGHRNCVNH